MAKYTTQKEFNVSLTVREIGGLERALAFHRAHGQLSGDDIAHSLYAFFIDLLSKELIEELRTTPNKTSELPPPKIPSIEGSTSEGEVQNGNG